MPFSSYLIPLAEAVEQTHSFQSAHPNQPKAYRIDRQELIDMLNVPEMQYVRAYSAIDRRGQQTMILVCVDAEGNDMTNIQIGGETISGTFNFAQPCPPTCPQNSPL